MCGERGFLPALANKKTGSSPRVWGTGLCLRVHGHTVRFIPTCVGNGPSGTQGRPCGMVHPHVCGERRGARGGDCCPGGSSPRVWGTEPSLIGNQIGRRFIPTCVGNGSLLLPQRDLLSVHPHVCGERRSTGPMMRLGFGSSPRVWGTVLKNNQDSCDQRFIPTCVGNGESRRLPLPAWAVHPHVCGERAWPTSQAHRRTGSSPRVWGTVIELILAPGCLRFIPTCVGNGWRGRAGCARWPVHPHVCGERVLQSPVPQPPVGSSPRVWGTVRILRICQAFRRFIPTCVGNGSAPGRAIERAAVHPHVCGERRRSPVVQTGVRGSSPRVWGTGAGGAHP